MTRRKRIYIVLSGENGEGGKVIKVFADPDTAIEQAPVLTERHLGPWVGGRVSEASVVTRCDVPVVASWESGCDWLEVQEWPVE